MTLTLPPETEARLRTVAAQRGLPPEETLDVILAEAEASLAQIVMMEEENQTVLAALLRSEEDYAAVPPKSDVVPQADTPLIHAGEKVEAELQRLERIVASTASSPSLIAARQTIIHRAHQPAISEDIEEADITDAVVLLRIDRSYRFGITAGELYEATRGDWAITPEKRLIKPRYAFAVVSFVIREVYIIAAWHPVPASSWGPGRWRFDGTVASDKADFIGKSVQSYINRRSSNPVRYVNC